MEKTDFNYEVLNVDTKPTYVAFQVKWYYKGKQGIEHFSFNPSSVELGKPERVFEEVFTKMKNNIDKMEILPDRFSHNIGRKFSINSLTNRAKEVELSSTKEDDLKVLENLKYIGPEIAKVLIAKFDSLLGVLNASDEDLISVPGIGNNNINKIAEQLNTLRGEN